jgi:hypothetical protein
MLRIAWSVACGLAAVLLFALWVRSYWWDNGIAFRLSDRIVMVGSSPNGVTLVAAQSTRNDFIRFANVPIDEKWRGDIIQSDGTPVPTARGFRWQYKPTALEVTAPHRVLVLFPIALGCIPWISWSRQFTIRTLLVGATLVAIVLAVIVWSPGK